MVTIYSLHPLYAEERDLEKKKGFEKLFELFRESDISPMIDIARPNLAKKGKRK